MPLRIHHSIDDIAAPAWDALAGPQPFLSHAYLSALERTGCVGRGTGWRSAIAALWRDGELIAALPLYLKTHSWGEYVFDWAWADAYAQHGLTYYPKWLGAVPFTPVPGPRLLARDTTTRAELLSQVLDHVRDSGASSLHILFAQEADVDVGRAHGMLVREGVQFHWHNAGYGNFDDFLAALSHDKRKKIRQERRKVSDAGVSLRALRGHEITAQHWAFFARCYATTYALHGATPYLNQAFFEALGAQLPASCLLLLAERGGTPLAASLLLCDGDAVYGRYWGAVEHVPCLHFEACYYRPIEEAIAMGAARFEGGAQGEHKLARGLDPVRTYSLHWLADERFQDAVAHYLRRETGGIELYVNELETRRPFKAAPSV
ncbi:MAG: GNAT family N-acetyltransferase [Rhodocyclaceae bacterium]